MWARLVGHNLLRVVDEAKHGLKQIMMNAKGFFFFKFDARTGLEAVMEGDSWDHSSFARCLIEVSSDEILKESITIGIPLEEGMGFSKENITVKYEWQPPRCEMCKVFGHNVDLCPKKVGLKVVEQNDGFQQVINKKQNNKSGSSSNNNNIFGNGGKRGFQAGKSKFAYVPKAADSGFRSGASNGGNLKTTSRTMKHTNDGDSLANDQSNNGTSNGRQQGKDVVDKGKMKISNISTLNPFATLSEDEEEEVENIWDESMNLNLDHNTRASTPAHNVSDVYVCAILESHVDVSAVYDTCKKFCYRWKWTSNGSIYDKGSRIILGWNDDIVDVMIMSQTNQVMHVQVNTQVDNKNLFCSFMYADNYYVDRRALWNNLVGYAGLMRDKTWVLLGYFNAALNLEDHYCRGYEPNISMHEFKDCVQSMEVMDVNCTGLHFTWNQKLKGSNGILNKIDRIMGNLQFNDKILEYFAIFSLNGFWITRPMCFGNLHDRVDSLRKEFDEAQKAIDKEPTSSILCEEHAHYLLAFKAATLDEERFLRQKSKVEWLNAGDFNTTYFHRIVKNKCARNQIKMVRDSSNVFYEGNVVVGAFVTHYENFLDIEGSTTPLANQYLFSHVLNSQKTDFMVRDVMDNEIKEALFSIGDDKAPALMVSLLLSLRKLGMLWVMMINDYRPISCCNVLYKCISKIIANCIKGDLGDLKEGSAFKVDIQKAYDTVDWAFLKSILICFGFHHKMVDWIMVCISTTSYSVCVNGDLHGWFRGKRGLKQGDPLGRPSFVDIIMLTLEEFKNVSGLVLSIPKSTSLFCNVLNALKATILNSDIYRRVSSCQVGFSLAAYEKFSMVPRQDERGKANVTWESVCNPKHEGGLGIRRLEDFNVTLRTTHIWCILTHKESLWVKWVHSYKLNGMLTVRDIVRSGFGLSDSVSDLIVNGNWRWPPDWPDRFLDLSSIQVPNLIDHLDDACYGVIRKVVLGISRHAFHMWLVTKQKLETQDRLQQWDVGPNTDLNLLRFPLCDLVHDSHSHLFFECHFSIQVWFQIRGLSGMDMIPPRFANIITFPILISKGRSIVSIIARILVAATTYYIWIERNSRLFKKKASTILHNVQVITFMVCLKLVSFKFKKVSTRSRLLLD
ncbi:hypothetical protein Tco_0452750 [Tanacetum coccineum]